MWNHDISSAPRDSDIWLATKCGKVIKSYWIEKFGPGRWAGLGTKEQPIAWQAFVVPAHPSQAETSRQTSPVVETESARRGAGASKVVCPAFEQPPSHTDAFAEVKAKSRLANAESVEPSVCDFPQIDDVGSV